MISDWQPTQSIYVCFFFVFFVDQIVHTPRTVLGFDFGRLRIGVAVGQEITATAQPLVTLTAPRQGPDWDAITRLIAEWRPQLLVVGVPRHADGSASDITMAALGFSRQLRHRYGLPVETMDERLSSHEAASRLAARPGRRRQARQGVDPLAAAVILESWFNQPRVNVS